MTSQIVVFGGTGKTGRRVVEQLNVRGIPARAASRNPREGQIHFDWHDAASWAPALEGARAVYLVPPDLVEDATALTGPLLQIARESGVERLVLLSSLGVTFPGEPRDSGRRLLEAHVRESGLRWTILRPSGFDQNFSEGFLLPGIVQGNSVVSATGSGVAPLVDANDIARVAVEALTCDTLDGQELAITGPEAISFDRAVEIIGSVSGRMIVHRELPPSAFQNLLCEFQVPPDYAAMLVRDQLAIRDGYAANVSNTVERITGKPAITFAEFARQSAIVWQPEPARHQQSL